MLDLLGQLRSATREVHGRLESDLDLLRRPFCQRRIGCFLEGMHGFHGVWEPGAGRILGAATLAGRLKGPHLRADLLAMGRTEAEIERLPLCREASGLARTRESALGAMYVLEGSTLGGQMISRALREACWLPPAGLASFNPYGAETGAQWRSFRAMLSDAVPPQRDAEVVAAALATFELLHRWLRPAFEG